MTKFLVIAIVIGLMSCSNKTRVDSIIINANVYTVNNEFEKTEAFAIKDGKFIEVGNSKELQNTFFADTIIDAKGKTIVPGFY